MDDFRKLIQIVENNSEIKKEGIGDSSPYQEGYNAWKDYLAGKTKQRPVNPYPAGQGMGEWENGAGDAAEHIDWGNGPLGETEAAPVTKSKWEVAIEYGPAASHTAKIKVSAPDADTAQTKALSIFKKKFPDRRGMVGDCTELK